MNNQKKKKKSTVPSIDFYKRDVLSVRMRKDLILGIKVLALSRNTSVSRLIENLVAKEVKRLSLILLLPLMLMACAPQKDSSSAAAPACGAKPLRSAWVTPDQSASISLVGLEFDKDTPMATSFDGGSKCLGTLRVSGDECHGTYRVTNMTWNGSGANPGCGSYNESGVYSKANSGLTLTDTVTTQSVTYQ
jgi:hypothetical protein